MQDLQHITLHVFSQDCNSFVNQWNWTTFSLVQTKKYNMLSFFEMKELVYIQTNLRMLESMGIDDAIQELNPDEIDITKVLSLHSRLEIEVQYFFLV